MEQIRTKVKKWGNSFGIIIPKEMVEKEKIREGSEITISMSSNSFMTVRDVLDIAKKNKLKRPKEDIQSIINKIDKELWE